MDLKFNYKKRVILVIPDMHIPYHHKDSFRFLKAVRDEYEPDLVVSVGDLADFHAISFHNSDPNLHSAGRELELLRKYSRKLENLFPKMIITSSNHGDLPIRKFVANGLPFEIDQNKIYGVKKGWKFINRLNIRWKDDPGILIAHNIKKDPISVASHNSRNYIQGHYHTSMEVKYIANEDTYLWGVNVGCLIDDDSLAFAYNKLQRDRPLLGATLVVDGVPVIIPMGLNSKGRWDGRV